MPNSNILLEALSKHYSKDEINKIIDSPDCTLEVLHYIDANHHNSPIDYCKYDIDIDLFWKILFKPGFNPYNNWDHDDIFISALAFNRKEHIDALLEYDSLIFNHSATKDLEHCFVRAYERDFTHSINTFLDNPILLNKINVNVEINKKGNIINALIRCNPNEEILKKTLIQLNLSPNLKSDKGVQLILFALEEQSPLLPQLLNSIFYNEEVKKIIYNLNTSDLPPNLSEAIEHKKIEIEKEKIEEIIAIKSSYHHQKVKL